MSIPGKKWDAKDPVRRYRILEAILTGKTRFNEIWQKVKGSRTSLKLYLNALEEDGLIKCKQISHKNVEYKPNLVIANEQLIKRLKDTLTIFSDAVSRIRTVGDLFGARQKAFQRFMKKYYPQIKIPVHDIENPKLVMNIMKGFEEYYKEEFWKDEKRENLLQQIRELNES
ncbi:MAG: winged helix-turn-helix transcriptional regulator [Candidatus Bathyarchaeota archaeon]|nr:winged helix-turn-helix transcriptional regulator [Candidatus Bathyarchaeota archaeon]